MRATTAGFVSKCKEALRIWWKRNPRSLSPFIAFIAFACLAVAQPLFCDADATSQTVSASASQKVDPNKGPSELNHHIIGLALIGVGLLQLATLFSSRHSAQRYVWPALFVLAGLFLALWSDGEIWPRGNLNWYWLLQHDAEARQHKIYSLLLIAMGIVEYARLSSWLPRFWKTWAFPMLAVIGATLLLIHDHTGGSGARLPEAQGYLVNPALDVDGGVRRPNPPTTDAATAENQDQHMDRSSEDGMGAHAAESGSMPMNHSQLAMDVRPSTVHTSHHHLMTASMLGVEREHLWFMIVGLAIGLFKFLSDSEFFHNRIVLYIWPGCMVLLGFMLVFYRE